MPAAAVIPALLVYVDVAEVEKHIVDFMWSVLVHLRVLIGRSSKCRCGLLASGADEFTLIKSECSKQAFA